MAVSNAMTAHVYIKGHDQASMAFGAVSGKVNAVTGKINRAATQVKSFGRAINSGMTMPMFLAAGASMKGAYDFSEAMNQVAATAQLSEDKMTPYTNAMREFGRTTQFTAVDAADGFNYLLQAGMSLDEALALLPTTLELAAASNMSLAKSADVSTNAFAGFGMASDNVETLQKNMVHLNDVAAYTATKANTNVPQMFMALKEAAPISAALGISLEQTAAIIGDFGNKGFQGAAAGRSFRTGLLRLIAPVKKARAAFADLGVDYKKFFSEENTLTGDKLSKALSSQGMQINSAMLQNILENSESDDLMAELIDKVVSQVGDKSVEARTKISQTIAESFAVNSEGLDIFGLFKTLREHNAGAAHLEAIFGKMQVAKFMAIINGEVGKGYVALEKKILAESDGAAQIMSETRMRGMVGGIKRFHSVVEGLNLSIWDSGLADEVTDGIKGIANAISTLDENDIENLLMAGEAIGAVILGGAAINGIANVGTSLVTLAGGLTKAAAGALLFAPYVAVGSALILGIGYLVKSYEEEGKASDFAAKAEKEHANQLGRVNAILGSVNDKSNKYGENLTKNAKLRMRLDVAEMNSQIPKQRAEIVGNLLTSGWGASNEIADLDDKTKAQINSLSAEFEKGTISIEKFSDGLYEIADKNIENAKALELVIKNTHALGLVVADNAEKKLILGGAKKNDVDTQTKIDNSLIMVSLGDNKEYQQLMIALDDNKQSISKISASPTLLKKSHFVSYASANSGFGVQTKEQKSERIEDLKAQNTELQIKIDNIEASIRQQNEAILQQSREPSEIKGQADVNVNIKVDGANTKYSSTTSTSSGHVKAKVNVGTSLPELEH